MSTVTLAEEMMRPRWRGQPGRLEVWYTTLTDPVTGSGLWLHHEMVSPSGGGPAHGHGWAAVFPPDRPPVLARFGPAPWPAATRDRGSAVVFAVDGVTVSADRLVGRAGDLAWELTSRGGGRPLFPFPAWAWRRGLLPATQVVPQPAATFDGTVHIGATTLSLAAAPGATARIYGRGHARRWAWLHADLGPGETLEVVAAVSNTPGLRLLRPLTFLRLRLGGLEWPSVDPLLAASLFRARLDLPEWSVAGRFGDLRVAIHVTLPPERTVIVDYVDPDGTPAVCHNSERADAQVTLEYAAGRSWLPERSWTLAGTAHAELGLRTPSAG